MTISITIKNTNDPADERKAAVFAVSDVDVLSTPVAELSGGQEVTTYLSNSQRIEITEI